MADVTQSVSVFEQIRLVAGLRWRILRNSLRKKNNRLDLIGLIFTGVFGGIMVDRIVLRLLRRRLCFSFPGPPGVDGLTLLGIFLFWQLFPVFVAGFGANFEFRTLLRFPLSLRAFSSSHWPMDSPISRRLRRSAGCWPWTAGAAVAKPGVLPAMLVIVGAFMLLNATLERLIGSWLERLLARRRTRELFLGLFVLTMVSLNFLSPLMQRYGASAGRILRLLPYFAWFPPFLAGRALAAIIRLHLRGSC